MGDIGLDDPSPSLNSLLACFAAAVGSVIWLLIFRTGLCKYGARSGLFGYGGTCDLYDGKIESLARCTKFRTGDLRTGEGWLYCDGVYAPDAPCERVGKLVAILCGFPSFSIRASLSEIATAPFERTCRAVTPR